MQAFGRERFTVAGLELHWGEELHLTGNCRIQLHLSS